MIKKIRKFWQRFKAIPALRSSDERQLELFWKKLQDYLRKENFVFGVYESAKSLRVRYRMKGEDLPEFSYFLHKTRVYLRCDFAAYDEHADAGNIFILAQHLNNLIQYDGIVEVDTKEQTCSLLFDVDYRPYLLGLLDLDDLINRHFAILLDVRQSYFRLLVEGEEPAIIFADLVASNKNEQDNNE